MQHGRVIAIVTIAAALVLALPAWRERVAQSSPDATEVVVDTGIVTAGPPANSAERLLRSSTPAPPPRAVAEPLPPPNAPLASTYDELAVRAKAGDNAAAMRLAFDLQHCSSTAGMTLDQAADRFLFCEGIDRERIDARGEWILLAADRGDAEAMVCYVAHPNDLGPKFLSDAWFDWSQRWRDRAPGFAERAYELGQADLLTLLAQAYSGSETHGMRAQHQAFTLLVRADPARGAAYQEMSRRVSAIGEQPVPLPGAYRDVLSEAERQRAQAIIDRDWPRFAHVTVALANLAPCIRLFRSMR